MDSLNSLFKGVLALKEWRDRVTLLSARVMKLTTAQKVALANFLARHATDHMLTTFVVMASVGTSEGSKTLETLESGLLEVEGGVRGSQGQA